MRQELILTVFIVVVVLFLFLFAFVVNGYEAGEFQYLTPGAKSTTVARDVNGGLVENRRAHLAGHKPVPDELIKFELIRREVFSDVLRL